jgi:hypothetical protein
MQQKVIGLATVTVPLGAPPAGVQLPGTYIGALADSLPTVAPMRTSLQSGPPFDWTDAALVTPIWQASSG